LNIEVRKLYLYSESGECMIHILVRSDEFFCLHDYEVLSVFCDKWSFDM
jgi:hypothetical protein